MEMEHINENTIRVLIKGEDLAARGITFLDLLGNHKEIENFFYSILEEVDVDGEFKGSEAVTFQVLPKDDGLELLISKNESLENMNPYELYGDQYSAEEITSWLKEEKQDFFENLTQEEMMEWFNKESTEAERQDVNTKKIKNENEIVKSKYLVFEFVNFEAFIQLVNERVFPELESNLYLFKDRYYLTVEFLNIEMSKEKLAQEVANFIEYARISHYTNDLLIEHGELIMGPGAIETARSYFS